MKWSIDVCINPKPKYTQLDSQRLISWNKSENEWNELNTRAVEDSKRIEAFQPLNTIVPVSIHHRICTLPMVIVFSQSIDEFYKHDDIIPTSMNFLYYFSKKLQYLWKWPHNKLLQFIYNKHLKKIDPIFIQ